MRTTEHCFCVAGFRLHIHVPEVWKMERMLPSFLPFRDKGAEGDVDLLDCEAFSVSASHPVEMSGTLLEETCNDMGYIRLFAQADRYEVSLSREPGGRLQSGFSFARRTMRPGVCCLLCFASPIRKLSCIIRQSLFMRQRSIAMGKPICSWEKAGRVKVPIRLCG